MRTARTTLALRNALAPSLPLAPRRFAPMATYSSLADTSKHPDTPAILPMTWTEYFAMRKSRKLWSTLTTIPSSVAGLFGGAAYFANLDFDPAQLIMGMDPSMVYGAAT